jgi:2-furoyl-CoA dehydrogenase large subunit
MSTPVCIANAIADALGPAVDPEAITLPLTPAKILALLGMPDPAPGGGVEGSNATAGQGGVLSRVSRWLGGRDG